MQNPKVNPAKPASILVRGSIRRAHRIGGTDTAPRKPRMGILKPSKAKQG